MERQDTLTPETVEQLIISLYQPNPPEVIASTQAALARIQSLPQAWELSKELLSRPDEKVQFFGVLTIIVKLNTQNKPIADDQAIELLFCLTGWYVDLVSKDGSRLVTRKLVSALSTFFIRHHAQWPRFLDHIGICLASNQPCRPDAMDPNINMSSILERLGQRQTQALLWLAAHIVEDVTRLDPNSVMNASTYKAVIDNTESFMIIMANCFQTKGIPAPILEDAIKCLQSWIIFSQKAPTHENDVISSLKPLLGNVIEFLAVDAVYDASAELLIETLSNNPSLFTPENYKVFEMLFKSPWAAGFYQRIEDGDFGFDTIQFAQLLLAFAETQMPFLLQSCHAESSELLSHLCGILLAQGYPAVDDRIFVPVVEFWSSFAETVPDYLPADSSQEQPWKGAAFSLLLKACSNAWQKITYPPGTEVSDWDSNDRAGFADSRKDVVDLLQSVYALVGPQLLGTFAETVIGSLKGCEWLRLEAAVYCLGGLADCCQDDDRCDGFLATVFHSELFVMLRNARNSVPARTQQTCLQLIELYTEYFERNPVLLPPALELLFSTLGDKAMAPAASRSILRLCSSCRVHLYTEIEAFLAEYARVIGRQQLDCATSERTIGALASVAQAIPNPKEQYAKYGRILEFIEVELQRCQRLANTQQGNDAELSQLVCSDTLPEENVSLHMALKVLRCLTGMGKGVQAPAENTIDLDHEKQSGASQDVVLPEIQRRIVNLIVALQKMFPTSNEITEQICNVLRTGFSETEPGPFVLPPSEVAQYLTSHSFSTPRVGLFISTACSFISSVREKDDVHSIFSAVLGWVIGLLRQFPYSHGSGITAAGAAQIDISAEPEVAQNAIEISSRMLTKDPSVILHIQPAEMAEFFFLFALQALDGNEPLPKAASAEFWATFVSVRSGDENFQNALTNAMNTLGPLLCQSLARNIGGNASRSELDKLSEPLKKLINRYPKAKEWLEVGLNHPSFPSTKVSQAEKGLFVKKVVSLRGARATNQIVRDFWLAARGSNFSYAA
ncbi:hypothetical protein NLG97_g173 [Lecanicillium saksenae]|uniref:Uncharacterized protein n=1 Tax=Lecanicillium saksenae TaxID=468837 RepID=A0ACC1RA16_9HYPO|nr:hypothetical protein NLG97_g173 [Lecanicillium saksenae]